jgi:hypothetical protein
MSDNQFHVIFTGRLIAGMDKATVMSNLVLDIGLSEAKARALLGMSRVVLKRFPTASEAQRLAEKFERAGAVCLVEDRGSRAGRREQPASGESSLITIISKFKPVSRREAETALAAEGNA